MRRYTNNGVLVRSALVQSGKATLCDGDDYTKDELADAIDQLSRYEDTGLTPDEAVTIKAENTRLRAELEAATSNDCDECRFKSQSEAWKYYTYPCNECRRRTKDHFDGVERATENGGQNA